MKNVYLYKVVKLKQIKRMHMPLGCIVITWGSSGTKGNRED
jgi:hypothetical protein